VGNFTLHSPLVTRVTGCEPNGAVPEPVQINYFSGFLDAKNSKSRRQSGTRRNFGQGSLDLFL
jgi:hypothetical protein